jgi:hypothetical protein
MVFGEGSKNRGGIEQRRRRGFGKRHMARLGW